VELKGQLASLAGNAKTTHKQLGIALSKVTKADEKAARLAKEVTEGRAWLAAKITEEEDAIENAKVLKAEAVEVRAKFAAQPFGGEDEDGQAMAAACTAIVAAAGQIKVPGAATELAGALQMLQSIVERITSEKATKMETQVDETQKEDDAAASAEAAWNAKRAEKQADADERKQELDDQFVADSMDAADNALRVKLAAITGDTGAAAMGEAFSAHKAQRDSAQAEAKRRRQGL
jgi:hypothetical protein